MNEPAYQHNEIESLFFIVILYFEVGETCIIFDVIIKGFNRPSVLVIFEILFSSTTGCGFKNIYARCEEPIALYNKEKKHGFPVIARLTYEEDGKIYEGTLECEYNWAGTKEISVELSAR